MQVYAEVLNIAIPVFLLLIIGEYLWSRAVNKETYYAYDTIASISSGISNIIKDVLKLSIVIISYSFLYDHVAILDIQSTVGLVIICFIGQDFAGYWQHRLEHRINILWNRHIIHHSSEEFNLACALRQTVSTVFALFTILLLPLAVLGVPPEVIAIVAPLHLFMQFWYHTRLIDRMGWLEYVIVTPSHHRVHHAINEEYLDRNFGQVFIVWDRLFGTFQEELVDVPAVYGVKRPARTYNPFIINFQHFYLMLKDAIYTTSWKDKLLVWIMPTGYRPDDRLANDPVSQIDDVYGYQKYRPKRIPFLVYWSWVQILIVLGLSLYLFSLLGEVSIIKLLPYVLLLYASIFAFTSLLDRHKWSLWAEFFRLGLFLSIFINHGDWYGIDAIFPYFSYGFIAYMLISTAVTSYFITNHKDSIDQLSPIT